MRIISVAFVTLLLLTRIWQPCTSNHQQELGLVSASQLGEAQHQVRTSKVSGSNLVIRHSIFEWCVIQCGSKNGHLSRHHV